MKRFILILLLILITGCGTEEKSIFKSDEEKTQETEKSKEEKRNVAALNTINNLIDNTLECPNYSFIYNINIDEDTFYYEGNYFHNVVDGKLQKNDTTLNYQISDGKVYNKETSKEIINFYENNVAKYIDLNNYYVHSNIYTCTIADNIATCQSKGPNQSISFTFNDNYITSIKYKENDNVTCELQYSNFNELDYITKINYDLNINYSKTQVIREETLIDDYNNPYNIYYYYVDDVKVNINNEEIYVTDTDEIFSSPMYLIDLSNYVQYKESTKYIRLYIYQKNFVIIIVNDKNKGNIYYLTTYDYISEILEEFVAIN